MAVFPEQDFACAIKPTVVAIRCGAQSQSGDCPVGEVVWILLGEEKRVLQRRRIPFNAIIHLGDKPMAFSETLFHRG